MFEIVLWIVMLHDWTFLSVPDIVIQRDYALADARMTTVCQLKFLVGIHPVHGSDTLKHVSDIQALVS